MLRFPRIEGTFLRSAVGRRIFLMFCVAVVLPAALVFFLTYRTASRNAYEASHAAMGEENKHYALTVFERLQAADAMLDGIDANAKSTATLHEPLLDFFFSEVDVLDLPLRAAPAAFSLTARVSRQWSALAPTGLLVLPAASGMAPEVVLVRRLPGAGADRLIVGRLRTFYLWGDPSEQSFNSRICIFAGAQRLSCTGDAIPAGTRETMHHDWDLFLKAEFATPSWTFRAVREPEPLLASHLRFLAPVAFGLLALVLLLSSLEIRRILVPLEALVERIRAIGGTPEATIEVQGKDEFATLTQTFGQMERRIGRQVATLQTLADIDRLILARVPVAALVDVVIGRIEQIVDLVATGVLVRGTGSDTRSFVRAQGQSTVEATLPVLPTALDEASDPLQADRRWRVADHAMPELERLGAQRICVLELGHRDQAQAWLALGCVDDHLPTEQQLAEVREVAERIAVALTVEAHERLMVFQARHDPLTGLGNRLAAGEALALAVERAASLGSTFAVVFIDLDRFKSINDGLGHALGDAVLLRAGERIKRSLGTGDFVARFGGDEFFVILQDAGTAIAAAQAMARITLAFQERIVADGVELAVRFSAGVALYPEHGVDAQQLIHNSDVAMYRAKKLGGGRIEFFEDEMNDAALSRVQLENDLRLAIRTGQLYIHYQPRVNSRDGSMVGAEALARWHHPVKGDISPAVFIALAEECGLIEELGTYVLHQACTQMMVWKRRGLELPFVAVNVSSHQLRSGNFVQAVSDAVTSSGIAWSALELEVTESLLINDSGFAAQQLQALRSAGARVAIDDFGTGYSSLAYLTKLPIDTLKIDRTFIASLDGSDATLTVIRSIIALATALGKDTVAEGVESFEHVRLLSTLGCHTIQGFIYYRPLDLEAMTAELIRLQTAVVGIATG